MLQVITFLRYIFTFPGGFRLLDTLRGAWASLFDLSLIQYFRSASRPQVPRACRTHTWLSCSEAGPLCGQHQMTMTARKERDMPVPLEVRCVQQEMLCLGAGLCSRSIRTASRSDVNTPPRRSKQGSAF